ncbi:hypothetical protein CWI75_06405 [Kineobactrum sediminis]|uniref:MobA-like NTP transferase domain-containing protein n=1 Tax=Kineobactrum sediminis TaxID=1905677 RepID=A0A2N5Y3S6_9GAMM|nr:nucleotidyltransferase family protein [Kineobactrum sediminis]PLW83051.1 hypothetical protein CWI75_06405 [Kineobactrum sediminis]
MTVGVLLLAAGRSARYGSDKRLARLPAGETLLATVVANVQRSGLPLRVCLRPDDGAARQLLEAQAVSVLPCPDSVLGMGHTIADAIPLLPACWRGVLIALADMPAIQPETFCQVATELVEGAIVVPVWRGRAGHPVAFSRAWFGALANLSGDRGARALIQANPGKCREIAVTDPGILLDIDRPSDLVLY